MGQIDEQNEPEQQEKDGSDKSDVVSPCDEKGVGNEEGEDDEGEPGEDLGAPESVLDGGSLVPRRVDAEEEYGQNKVEKTEGEVEAVDSDKTEALLANALQLHVIEG